VIALWEPEPAADALQGRKDHGGLDATATSSTSTSTSSAGGISGSACLVPFHAPPLLPCCGGDAYAETEHRDGGVGGPRAGWGVPPHAAILRFSSIIVVLLVVVLAGVREAAASGARAADVTGGAA
jgi:hypothetical protein